MQSPRPGRILLTGPEYVNSTIDKIIRLSEVDSFEKVAKTTAVRYPVRVMQLYDAATFDAVSPADEMGTRHILQEWAANKGEDFNELMTSLRLFASTSDYIATNRIERTKLDGEIIEIKDCGQRLRLFAFVAEEEVIIIAEHYQKHGRSPKEERQLQNKAINRAIARRKLFLKATKVDDGFYHVAKQVKGK